MTIKEMIERKHEIGYSNAKISELSGVPLPTVEKIFSGKTKSPRYDTVCALERVLKEAEVPEDPLYGLFAERMEGYPSQREIKEIMGEFYTTPEERKAIAALLRERALAYNGEADPAEEGPPYADSYPLLPYKRQGEYTTEDRDRLPEDVRTELVDGVIYDLASPRPSHQVVLSELSFQFYEGIEKTKIDGFVFISPTDVFLDSNDKTAVQPDLMIVTDKTALGEKGIQGAPALIVEILSPSTRSKDLVRNCYKYLHAGVKEYWIVDHKEKWIRVYDYDKNPDGTVYTEYTFEDKVPIALCAGKHRIDFNKINAKLKSIADIQRTAKGDPWSSVMSGLKLFTDDFLREPVEDLPLQERETL